MDNDDNKPFIIKLQTEKSNILDNINSDNISSDNIELPPLGLRYTMQWTQKS